MKRFFALLMSFFPIVATSASFNVRDAAFGAKGDGSVDDSGAIQMALDMSRGDGEPIEVVIPDGTYKIAKMLGVYSNTTLTLGRNARLVRAPGSDINVLLSTRHLGPDGFLCYGETCEHGGYEQIKNVVISGGIWDGGGDAEAVTGAIMLRHGENIELRNVTMTGFTEHMLNLSGTRHSKVENCRFVDALEYTGTSEEFWSYFQPGDPERFDSIEAIHIDVIVEEGEAAAYPIDRTKSSDIEIRDCHFDNVYSALGNHHVYANIPQGALKVSGCVFNNVYSYALHAHGFSEFHVTDCAATNTSGLIRSRKSRVVAIGNAVSDSSVDAFNLFDDTSSEIKTNVIVKTGRHGLNQTGGELLLDGNDFSEIGIRSVNIQDLNGAKVRGNAINGGSSHGLYLVNCSGCDVTDNAVDNSGGNGITLQASFANIGGNVVRNPAGSGIRIEQGSSAVVVSNEVCDAATYGISAVGTAPEVAIRTNRIVNSGDTAIYASASNKADVDGNIIVSPLKHGIQIASSADCRIASNEIVSPAKYGIYVSLSDGATVGKNQVTKSGDDGILYHQSVGGTLEENVVLGAMGYGLRVQGTATKTATAVVRGNRLETMTSGLTDLRIGTYSFNCTVADNRCLGYGPYIVITDVLPTTDYHPADAQIAEITRTSLDRAEVSWEPVVGVSGYIVEAALPTTLAPAISIRVNNPSAAQCALRGLDPSPAWIVRVRTYQTIAGCDYESLGNSQGVMTEWSTQDYTILFHKNDGSGETQERAFGYGVETRMPYLENELVWGRAGMVPKGWATSEAAAEAGQVWCLDGACVTNPVEVGQVLDLYVVWAVAPSCYAIRFDGNGASAGAMLDQTGLTCGTPQALKPNAFSRTGFVFRGWSEDPSSAFATYADGELMVSPRPDPTGTTMTLYAVWGADPACYTVRYDGNGATAGEMPDEGFFYPALPHVLASNRYSRVGHVFLGWSKFPKAETPTWTDGADLISSTQSGGLLVLYAVWAVSDDSYTVVFDANGGMGTMKPQFGFVYGQEVPLSPNAFVYTGYVFLGWARSPSATEVEYRDCAMVSTPDPMVPAGETMTLYAVWGVDSSRCYTVHFDGNGATFGKMEDQCDLVPGKSRALKLNGFSWPGHVFLGWSKYPKAVDPTWVDGDTINTSTAVGDTLILYAVWTDSDDSYTVVFDANGGMGTMKPQSGFACGYGTPLNANSFVYSGFTFLGWARSPSATEVEYEDCAIVSDPNPGVPPGGTMTLYAIWTVDPQQCYTVRFDGNGAVLGVMDDQQGLVPGKSRALKLNQFVRPGFVFVGWSKFPKATSPTWTDGSLINTSTAIGEVLTLYAIWQLDPSTAYTIIFDAGEGSGSMPALVTGRDFVFNLPECRFEPPEGKVFRGWCREDACVFYDPGILVFNMAEAGATVTLTATYE